MKPIWSCKCGKNTRYMGYCSLCNSDTERVTPAEYDVHEPCVKPFRHISYGELIGLPHIAITKIKHDLEMDLMAQENE